MLNRVEKLVSEFIERGWKANTFDTLQEIIYGEPDQVSQLLRAIMLKIPDGGTFFETAISYLSPEEFPMLASDAIRALEAGENRAAESFICYTSLQFPSVLHSDLETLFSLQPNSRTFYENWPWRESGTTNSAFLRHQIDIQEICQEVVFG
ncbi:MAG: hypothetical protein RJP95_00330 [Pirellulales bacterium]